MRNRYSPFESRREPDRALSKSRAPRAKRNARRAVDSRLRCGESRPTLFGESLETAGHLVPSMLAKIILFTLLCPTLSAHAAFAQQSYPTQALPVDVAAGDLNQDGFSDVLAAEWTNQTMTFFAGDGTGALNPARVLTTFGQTPSSIALADVNFDGLLDIVNGTFDGNLLIYTNNGGASFAMLPFHPYGTAVNELRVVDMNLDGVPDVVAAHNFSNNVSVCLGAGTGFFNIPLFTPATLTPVSIDAGRIDGDEYPDVVAGSFQDNALTVLRGDGFGGFFGGSTFFTNNTASQGVELADFNFDGANDVLVSTGNSYDVPLYKGDGLGGLAPASILQTCEYPGRARSTDFNKDGRIDVATTSTCGPAGVIHIFPSQGGFNFSPPISPGAGTPSPWKICITDLDHAGDPDLVYSDGSTDQLFTMSFGIGQPAATGVYGTGTPGCGGRIPANTNQIPFLGNGNFTIGFTYVPRNTLGLGIAANASDIPGTDYFGIGALLHCDIVNASDVQTFDIYTEGSGMGFAPVPIPNNPQLQNMTYYVCGLFLEDLAAGRACGTSPIHIVSSAGLFLTLL